MFQVLCLVRSLGMQCSIARMLLARNHHGVEGDLTVVGAFRRKSPSTLQAWTARCELCLSYYSSTLKVEGFKSEWKTCKTSTVTIRNAESLGLSYITSFSDHSLKEIGLTVADAKSKLGSWSPSLRGWVFLFHRSLSMASPPLPSPSFASAELDSSTRAKRGRRVQLRLAIIIC